MKRILFVTLFAIMGFVAIAAADEAKKAEAPKPVTMTGEVLDLYCYMDHTASGPDHAKCASACVKKGLPVGFLSSDGVMYLIIGKEHEPINAMVADYCGKKSTITGTVKENGGVKAIELASISEAKAETK
jgi:hypothetical protein